MDDIAAADSVFVLLSEAQKRVCGISYAGLYLNRVNFVLRFAVIRENKVDVNTSCVRIGNPMVRCRQELCAKIFAYDKQLTRKTIRSIIWNSFLLAISFPALET